MTDAQTLAAAVAKYADSRKGRDDAIRAASAAGMTLRAIAEVTGLSFQRIAQIVDGH